MRLISGKEAAEKLTAEIKNRTEEMKQANKRLPKLVIIRVGERQDDISYQKAAIKRMDMAGILHEEVYFEENILKEEFYEEFDKINSDESADGILVLRPLPKHLDENLLLQRINPQKDVDGISPVNLGKIMTGDEDGFAPCTAAGVMEILKFAGIELRGKKVAIIGRSNVVGKPLALMLIGKDATVTVCHSRTEDIKKACKNADIVIAACGKARLIDKGYVADGATVIDVGINLDEDGKLCGDVDIKDIEDVAAACTPVPGGVGAVTTSILAKQVFMAYEALSLRCSSLSPSNNL